MCVPIHKESKWTLKVKVDLDEAGMGTEQCKRAKSCTCRQLRVTGHLGFVCEGDYSSAGKRCVGRSCASISHARRT